jgi:hypothetical protein
MSIPENVGIIGLSHDHDLTACLGGVLSEKTRSGSGDQTKQQSERSKREAALTQTTNTLKNAQLHRATPRLKVETWRKASCG